MIYSYLIVFIEFVGINDVLIFKFVKNLFFEELKLI